MNAQKDFSKLSPRQKIKLGKKEQKAAKNDPEYLRLMDEGLAFFQLKEYEKAMTKYVAAHNRRPENVYPVVMIEDVEIAKELISSATKAETDVVLENNDLSAKIPDYKSPETNIEPKEDEKKESPVITEVKTPTPIVISTPEKLEKQTTKVSEPIKTEEEEEKKYKNDGIFRETLKEGSATIYQVTVVKNGNATVIRQVVHTWGGVFYFKDKDAITKQEYEKLISELED